MARAGEAQARIRAFYDEVLGAGRLTRLGELCAPTYTPHLPTFARGSGLAPGLEALRARLIASGPMPHRLARIIADGDLLFAHVLYEAPVPVAGVDVYRLDATARIGEHWSVRQPYPHGAAEYDTCFGDAVAADAAFPHDSTWVRSRLERMLRELWAQGRPELVPQYYAGSYVQHNPDLPGGYERIERMVRKDIRRYMERTGGDFPIRIHHLAAQGDLACVHLSIFMAGLDRDEGARSTNVDIFRVDRSGCMTEHWDVLQIDGVALPDGVPLF